MDVMTLQLKQNNTESAIDPVCGMTVVVVDSKHLANHGGKYIIFVVRLIAPSLSNNLISGSP